ncbi:MAG: Hsp70 family protein [Myxococcales bacterium]|nr:Hsp70 family protein [Myxococcales bacterium]
MSRVLGIDLGSDSCSLATFVDGQARVVEAQLPTAVGFDGDGIHVGEEALPIAERFPTRFIDNFMRLLGRKLHSPEVDWLAACCPYPVIAADNGDALVVVEGRSYSPQELCSYVLEAAARHAEEELGLDIAEVVIAVPASFDQVQRRGVLDAADLAGLSVSRLVSHGAAGAVGYASLGAKDRRFAIVDAGAGTYEVTLAEIAGNHVKVLSTASDPLLGGADIDRRLIMLFLELCYEATREDLSRVPEALRILQQRARRTKQYHSRHTKSEPFEVELPTPSGRTVSFPFPGLSRRALVELAAQELSSLKAPVLWAFEDAGLGTGDLDEVMLLGGGSRMPAFPSAVKYLFRTKPHRPAISGAVIAIGAARIGDPEQEGRTLTLQDVASVSSGIKVRAGRFAPLVLRNRPLPCRVVKVFQAAKAKRVVFEVYQGENEVAVENTYVGRFHLEDMPADGRFPLVFEVDESGLIQILAVDPEGGGERPVPLTLGGGLSDTEVDSLRKHRAERARPSSLPDPSEPHPTMPPGSTPLAGHGGTLRLIPTDGDSLRQRLSRTQRPIPPAARQSTGTLVMNVDPPAKSVRAETMRSREPQEPPAPRADIEVAADALVGSVLEGRYRIDKILADGGMGRIYRAEHTFLGKPFAIKVLHPELSNNRDITHRFIKEARAASAIKSDHVVSISDFGTLPDGTGYFVMEYLEGRSLEEVLDDRGAMPADAIRSIGIQVADGLRGAHELDIVHRDLKPANIMMVDRPDHPHHAKILDFGIAKSPTSDSGGHSVVTMVGVMMGTPHYMAPEQIDGVAVDGRSDIYALGVVMFEMATGVPPFDAESVAEVLAKHKWGEVPRIHDVLARADCPPSLEQVIRKCLEKSPQDRYQTAQELARALAGS